MSGRDTVAGDTGAPGAFTVVPRLSPDTVAALVNEWATAPQELSAKPWTGFPGASSEPRERLVREWPVSLPEPDDTRIREAADSLYPLFTVRYRRELTRLLNTAVEEVELLPVLVFAGDIEGGVAASRGDDAEEGRVRRVVRSAIPADEDLAESMSRGDELDLRWRVAEEDCTLPAAMLATLIDAVRRSGPGSLGACGAGDCGDVYIDLSPPRTKRYCSRRCQTRERVRAHRGRRLGSRDST